MPCLKAGEKTFFKGEKGGTNPVFKNSFLEFSMFCKEKQRKQRKTKKNKEKQRKAKKSKENKEKQRKAKKENEKERKPV